MSDDESGAGRDGGPELPVGYNLLLNAISSYFLCLIFAAASAYFIVRGLDRHEWGFVVVGIFVAVLDLRILVKLTSFLVRQRRRTSSN